MADISRTTLVLGTGAGVLGVDQLTPTINWVLSGCPAATRPDSTASLIAAGVIIMGTAAFHYLQSRIAKSLGAQNPPPAGPAA